MTGTVHYQATVNEALAVEHLNMSLFYLNAAEPLSSRAYGATAKGLTEALHTLYGKEAGDAVDELRHDNHGEPNAIQLALDYVRANWCDAHGYNRFGCPCDADDIKEN